MCVTANPIRPDQRVPVAFDLETCPGRANCSGACAAIGRLGPSPALARAETIAPPEVALPVRIAEDFVADILSPYKPHARYLKSAEITAYRDKQPKDEENGALVKACGRFAIPESCYIDDTGHFNAVEFNICFNQLAYVMFGKCIEAGIMHRLRCGPVEVMSLSEYKRRQLPAMVIVSIESRYFKQLNSRDFRGELAIDKISPVGSAWFFFTSVTFADADGVKAKGSVVLAYSPTFTPART